VHITEHSFLTGALGELLGMPVDKVNDGRLHRALDKLLTRIHRIKKNDLNRGVDSGILVFVASVTRTNGFLTEQAPPFQPPARALERRHMY
jgi:hypothetical protein